MSQMINAGHIAQDSQNTIILKGQAGEQRFGVDMPPHEVEVQFDMAEVFEQDDRAENS